MIETINGLNINYETAGEGETVLMLHGWGGQIASFKPVFDNLCKQYRVIAIDFPGFGKSDIPKETWGVEEYADLVNQFLVKLNIERVNIIAHSFGGRVSIVFATKYQTKLGKLILVDSAGLIPRRTLKYYFKVYSFKLLKSIYLAVTPKDDKQQRLDKFYAKFGSKDFKDSGNLRSIFTKVINQDLKPLLKKITAPTLLVWGENDKDTPVYFGKIMEKEIPDAGLIIFKDAGHFAYLDKLNDFCIITKNFLQDSK